MPASDHLHPDLFGGVGPNSPPNWRAMAPDMRSDKSADVAGPVHGPAEPPVHGPPKPMTERGRAVHEAGRKQVRGKAFNLGYSEPEQLSMFMGARDLKNTINASYDTDPISEHATHYGLSSEERSGGWGTGEVEELSDMWGRKLAESKLSPDTGTHGSGVHESISKEGYRPHASVTLHWNDDEGGTDIRVHDAHHRIAAAADIEETTGRNLWIHTQHEDPDIRYRLRKGIPSTPQSTPNPNPLRAEQFKKFNSDEM